MRTHAATCLVERQVASEVVARSRKWYLAISPRPLRYSRGRQRRRAARCRRAPRAAARTRRRGSCPRAGSRRSCRRWRRRPGRAAWSARARRRAAVVDAAAKPAMSVTTPPPTATTTSPRVRPHWAKSPAEVLDGAEVLASSPSPMRERAVLDARVDLDADAGLGDDGGPLAPAGQHLEQPVAGAGADQHRVAAVAEGDLDLDHAAPACDPARRWRAAQDAVRGSSRSSDDAASVPLGVLGQRVDGRDGDDLVGHLAGTSRPRSACSRRDRARHVVVDQRPVRLLGDPAGEEGRVGVEPAPRRHRAARPRFSGRITTPPPAAMTDGSGRSSGGRGGRPRRRGRPSSPSVREPSAHGAAGAAFELLVAVDGRAGRAGLATRRPTVVLPEPIIPTSTTWRARQHGAGDRPPGLSPTAARRRRGCAPARPPSRRRTCGCLVGQHQRRHGPVVVLRRWWPHRWSERSRLASESTAWPREEWRFRAPGWFSGPRHQSGWRRVIEQVQPSYGGSWKTWPSGRTSQRYLVYTFSATRCLCAD